MRSGWAVSGFPDQPSKTAFTLFVGSMLAVTAFPVLARILQEKRMTQSAMGSVGIAAAAIVTVMMFLDVAVAKGVAAGQSSGEIAMVFVWTAVMIVVLFGAVRPVLVPLGRKIEAAGELDASSFAVCIVVMFATAYASDRIGTGVIVGGFLAGAVMPARADVVPCVRGSAE